MTARTNKSLRTPADVMKRVADIAKPVSPLCSRSDAVSPQIEAVARLSLENAHLREALYDQWLENHWEHCGDEWPHPSSRAVPCGWPLPGVLEAS